MDDELDLVVFEDDAGNEITMEVLDYFFYEGQEYAMLTDYKEEKDDECANCENQDCESCDAQEEVIIMKVVPVGEDEEEFIPVDEELGAKLVEMIENGAFDDEFVDDEDEDE